MTDARIPQSIPPIVRTDCPNCAALRASSKLLADSALYLIDRNADLTSVLEAYRARDRRDAAALLGLADLQRAPL